MCQQKEASGGDGGQQWCVCRASSGGMWAVADLGLKDMEGCETKGQAGLATGSGSARELKPCVYRAVAGGFHSQSRRFGD